MSYRDLAFVCAALLAVGTTQLQEDARARTAAREFARNADRSTTFSCTERLTGDVYPSDWPRPSRVPVAAAYQPCVTAHGTTFYVRYVRDGDVLLYHDCIRFTHDEP